MMNSEIDTPRMYIVVRTDLASMTPGRVAAQVSHATSQAAWEYINNNTNDTMFADMYRLWANESGGDQGFGTTIVLDGGDITNLLEIIGAYRYSNYVVDETYPLLDGTVTHCLCVTTCLWVLEYPHNVNEDLRNLPLYNKE